MMSNQNNLVGQVVKGYQIIKLISEDNQKVLYQAYYKTFGRVVAIQHFSPQIADTPSFIRSFESNAQLVAQVDHIHIVPILDFWRDLSGAYVVMRWMDGGSLEDFINIEPLDMSTVAGILDQICSGLNHAHQRSVYHGLINFKKILFDSDNNAYLAGFQIINRTRLEKSERKPFLDDIRQIGNILKKLIVNIQQKETASHSSTLEEIAGALEEVLTKATDPDPKTIYSDPISLVTDFKKAANIEKTSTPSSVLDRLTMRELEIWQLIVQNKPNREIADELVVEISTIKWHITQLYRKLDIKTRVQAINRASEIKDFLLIGKSPHSSLKISYSEGSATAAENPYKGLQPFISSDHDLFFGRHRLLQEIIERLNNPVSRSNLIVLTGPSGCGKSSFLHAKLIPEFQNGAINNSDTWFIISFTPGSAPLLE